MARYVITAGHRLRRRSTVKLAPAERAALAGGGPVVLRRAVVWPVPGRAAELGRAYVDAGGTDLWGAGPYLKVPNRRPGDGDDDEVVNRVFCLWGYPPDRVRVAWSGRYLRIDRVDLAVVGPAAWEWRLTVTPDL